MQPGTDQRSNPAPMQTKLSLRRLQRELQALPTRPSVAMHVIATANDPSSSANSLGRLIEIDPALTAQVMRLANSAYYGLNTRVASAARAVAVIGFSTVRALAAGMAAGVLAGGPEPTPPGYWEHSVATAVAGSLVAERIPGVSRGDAFSLGLLHDIGSALLYRCDPAAYNEVERLVEEDGFSLTGAEIAIFGAGHDDVAADVLGSWNFPDEFVRALAEHHEREPLATSPLLLSLVAAEDISMRLDSAPRAEHAAWVEGEGLMRAGIAPDEGPALLVRVQDEAAAVASTLAAA